MKIFKTIVIDVEVIDKETFKLFNIFEKKMKFNIDSFTQSILPPDKFNDYKYKIIRSYLLNIKDRRRETNYDSSRQETHQPTRCYQD